MKALTNINDFYLYKQFANFMRKSFANFQTEEELNSRMEFLFQLTSYFFLKNGPRNKQKPQVIDKLEFYKKHINPNSNVADVGCFDGYYTQQLRQYGCDVIGIDPNKIIIKKTKKYDPDGKYVRAFGENLPFSNNYFDVGLYSHVLHHVLNPKEVVKEARRVIKPEGKMIVVVPLKMGADANHLRYFNKTHLENLLGEYFSNIDYYPHIGVGHGCIASK